MRCARTSEGKPRDAEGGPRARESLVSLGITRVKEEDPPPPPPGNCVTSGAERGSELRARVLSVVMETW